jgi:hypothetical protein
MDIIEIIIVAPKEARSLMFDRENDHFYLATFRLDQNKLYFQRIFSNITSNAPKEYITRGIFANKDLYFTANTGKYFYPTPGNKNINGSYN